MARFNNNGCTLQIVDNSSLGAKGVGLLEDLILELPELIETAIGASSAPRHTKYREDRDEFVHIRRKWFGKKRGRVRHTFQDIHSFLEHAGNTLVVSTHGSQCEVGAHAYTPEGQTGTRREIYLCDKFFRDDATGQLSTIVHELTHLIRNTEDFEVNSKSDLDFMSTADLVSMDANVLAQKKKAFFLNELGVNERAHSAYNFEYFVADLIKEAYGHGVLVPARKGK
jgi:hypothetical protein